MQEPESMEFSEEESSSCVLKVLEEHEGMFYMNQNSPSKCSEECSRESMFHKSLREVAIYEQEVEKF